MDKILHDEAVRLGARCADFGGKRILVTGGGGFLGSWLCNALSAAGGKVLSVDNLSTGTARYLDDGVELLINNVEDLSTVDCYDYIFHMASRASPEEYQLRPVETLTANSIGTISALELARKCEAVLVFASTSEVYGDAEVLPTPETYWGRVNPIGVRSCYDEGKRFGEAVCMAYHRRRDTKVRIARIFNSYGPGLRHDGAYGRVVSRFVSQALLGEDLTVFGDGTQTRSLCFASDTVRGLLKLASSPGIDGEAFNLGNAHEMTVNQIAETIIKKTSSKSKIIHLPPLEDDPRRRCPNTSKAATILKWTPEVDLDEGLTKTVRWISSQLSTHPSEGLSQASKTLELT